MVTEYETGQLYEITRTGALVERDPDKARRAIVREFRATSGHYAEAMQASPTPIPGGWRMTVFCGEVETR